jgi:hypothetical protein
MLDKVRRAMREDNLEGFYAHHLEDDVEIERGLAAGRLVHDVRFREFMERIADSPAAVARPVATQDSGDPTLAAERAQLEYDAMHVLGRTERMLMIRQDFRARSRKPSGTPARRRPLRRRIRHWAGALLGRGRTEGRSGGELKAETRNAGEAGEAE